MSSTRTLSPFARWQVGARIRTLSHARLSPYVTYFIRLTVANILAFAFLASQHNLLPMWAEGPVLLKAEDFLTLLGRWHSVPASWMHLLGLAFPLVYNEYVGVGLYAYLPAVYLWFNGLTGDPYVYRYVGILLLLVNSYLLYILLDLYFSCRIAFFGAIIYLTTPVLLLGALTDHQTFTLFQLTLLVAGIVMTHYWRHPSPRLLFASALAAGLPLLTRIEIFGWPFIATALYLIVARPPQVIARLKQIAARRTNLLLVGTGVGVGAAPLMAYHIAKGGAAFFNLLNQRVLPGTFGSTAPSTVDRVNIRIEQFWSTNLLTQLPSYQILEANWLFAVVWLLAFAMLILQSFRSRRLNPLVFSILVILPVSIITRGLLRYEHLIFLELCTLFILITGLLAWQPWLRSPTLLNLIFIALIGGNLWTASKDWLAWNAYPPSAQTMLNQSDPILLADSLARFNADDRILYTNVGLMNYVEYVSAGRVRGEDIEEWNHPEQFENTVKGVLMDESRRRVFVGVAPEREEGQSSGVLVRTRRLYSVLSELQIPYSVTRLASQRNPYLYDIIMVERGVTLQDHLTPNNSISIQNVCVNPINGEQVVAGITGAGFEKGDMVKLN
jgi:hypothetical protein